MAAPQRYGMSPDILEFMAMESNVDIYPSISLPETYSFEGSSIKYGPFKATKRVTVPLWLAVLFKKKQNCQIACPTWMTPNELESTLQLETSRDEFASLPSDYVEVSKVLLEHASDDLPTPDRIRVLLKDIREARQSKIRLGLQSLNSVHLMMPNLSRMEINEIKPFFAAAHSRLLDLDPRSEELNAMEELWRDKPDSALQRAEQFARQASIG